MSIVTREIVVGVDGGAESVPVRLAAHAQGPIVVLPQAVPDDGPPGGDHPVVLVWDEGPLLRAAAGIPLPLDFTAANVRNRDLLDAAVEPAAHRHPEVIVHQHVVSGRPTDCLFERSGGAALLVVGSRGHGRFAGMLIGSVSASMIAHARCPVAVIRG